MKIYKITIEDIIDNPKFGLQAMSLVNDPAVEREFLKFNKEINPLMRFAKDEDKRIITGVALLADTPIFRWDKERGEYYVVFEKDTIRSLVEKYSRDGLFNMVNLQHDERTYTTKDCTLIESYIVDKERGICPQEFSDVPNGSWIVSYKVNNIELWRAIKEDGNINGFSVEVMANIMPMVNTTELEKPIGVPENFENDITPTGRYILSMLGKAERMNFDVTKREVRDAMNKKMQLILKVGDKDILCQIKDMGIKDGDSIINAYIPDDDVWKVIKIDDIRKLTITEDKLAPFNYDAPGFKEIQDDNTNIVTESISASRENIIKAAQERLPVMIKYNDESEEHNPATGYRQVEIVCYGYSLAGNEIFRAYQHFGDTSSDTPAWKLFLTKRCLEFRIMTEAQKFGMPPSSYHIDDVDIPDIIYQIPEGQSIFPQV